MSFQPFTSVHFITLAIGFVIIGMLIVLARRSEKSQRIITALLAFCNLVSYPFALYAWREYPHSLDNLLPFHLCDLAAIVAGFALVTRRPILLTLTYFWGLAATTQALITPALSIGPPELPFIHFFFQHFVIVAAALYIPIVLKWRPKQPWWKSPIIVLAISIGYQATALLINAILKTNFAFVSDFPDNPSLIDHLGPWPVYLFAMQGLALIFFLLLALPFRRSSAD
ncbi:MAG: TIGR02206 family membrane protein [Akkermansiaceae bacterium]